MKRYVPITDLKSSKTYAEYVYRTKNGLHLFRFAYVYYQGYYEIVILEQPSYGARNTSVSIIHKISSNSTPGKKIVCIANPTVDTKTLAQARSLSTAWAELTSEYILSGTTLDEQVRRLQSNNR